METTRDKKIDEITSNLLMAGCISPRNVPEHLKILHQANDDNLTLILVESKLALDTYYERMVYLCRDFYNGEAAKGLSL